MEDKSASQQIDSIIKMYNDWRGKKLAELREIVTDTNTAIIEEVKWKKPSKPEGIPVWSHNGIICVCDTLKNAVRLTFPKGAHLRDPQKLFNTRLDSKTVRAIDFYQDETVDKTALQAIITEAIKLNNQ